MNRTLRITVVDDNAKNDLFYASFAARLREDFLHAVMSVLDAEHLLPSGQFDPKRTLENIRKTEPHVLLMDLVLHDAHGRHDLILCDWLTREIQKDGILGKVPLVYISNFFGDHYAVPLPWSAWCFAKQALLSDGDAWTLFKESLEDLSGGARRQKKLRRLPQLIIRDASS